MFRLDVGGRLFLLSKEDIGKRPDGLLAKCFLTSSELKMLPNPSTGNYEFHGRDPDLFQHVVLPMLRNGFFNTTPENKFEALNELAYFGLVDIRRKKGNSIGLSQDHCIVLCKTALERIVNTFTNTNAHELTFLNEIVDTQMHGKHFDVSLFTTFLSDMFRSIALTEYQLFVEWKIQDSMASPQVYSEINYSQVELGKSWKNVGTVTMSPTTADPFISTKTGIPLRCIKNFKKGTFTNQYDEITIYHYFSTIHRKNKVYIKWKKRQHWMKPTSFCALFGDTPIQLYHDMELVANGENDNIRIFQQECKMNQSLSASNIPGRKRLCTMQFIDVNL